VGSFRTGALALESVPKRYFLYLASQNGDSAKPCLYLLRDEPERQQDRPLCNVTNKDAASG
jgi:hypothetical protein